MFSPSRIIGIVCGAAVVACLLACGATQKVREAADRTKRSNELKMIGLCCLQYHDEKRTFPPDQQTLQQWAQQMFPEAVPAIQKTGPGGQYTVAYGPWRLPKDFEPQGAGGTVLGYESQPSPQGRLVLTADGAVRMMNEAEFAAAARPKGAKK
jgi:hypothetical protein